MNLNVTPNASSKYRSKHRPSVFPCAQKELVAQIAGLA